MLVPGLGVRLRTDIPSQASPHTPVDWLVAQSPETGTAPRHRSCPAWSQKWKLSIYGLSDPRLRSLGLLGIMRSCTHSTQHHCSFERQLTDLFVDFSDVGEVQSGGGASGRGGVRHHLWGSRNNPVMLDQKQLPKTQIYRLQFLSHAH